MAITDIKRGHLLEANGKKYAIRFVMPFDMEDAGNPSFVKMATVSASVTRQPTSTGAASDPVSVWSGMCLPLDPVSQAVLQRVNLKTPFAAKQTEVSDADGYLVLVLEDIA